MTNYTREVAILTTKVTQIMACPINSCFFAVEQNSEITEVRLRVTPLKSWGIVYRTISTII